MDAALLATKLYIPQARPDLVPRPRLTDRLREAPKYRLVLISAPAGSGKTSLLSEWRAGPGRGRGETTPPVPAEPPQHQTFQRQVAIYVPAGYVANAPAPFIVVQDERWFVPEDAPPGPDAAFDYPAVRRLEHPGSATALRVAGGRQGEQLVPVVQEQPPVRRNSRRVDRASHVHLGEHLHVAAVRARNLTWLADNPFTFVNEEDRYLAFADLLFDVLAPRTPERHRALVRIEDVDTPRCVPGIPPMPT